MPPVKTRLPAIEGWFTLDEEAPALLGSRCTSCGNFAFAIAAVELAAEQMVVMGQMVPGVDVDSLSVGSEVELVLDTLYEDDEHEYVVWKWRPVGADSGSSNGKGQVDA